MNHVEHYHDWLRDAHAMEKQAESMLESMAGRIDNYPDLRARIEQHVNETKRQITVLPCWKRSSIAMRFRAR